MRGAAYLSTSGLDEDTKNAIVADIGGTTTDIGQLVNGFPRQAANRTKVLKAGGKESHICFSFD